MLIQYVLLSISDQMARGTISITFPAVLIQGENMIKLILDYNILDAYKSESSYCGAQ